MPAGPNSPTRRVVLLGASNLTMGIGRAYRSLRHAWAEPLEILVAMGHGRSYGLETHALGRYLPGITECGLWTALAQSPPLPTTVLITDVGNDVVYGVLPEELIGWVETCLGRLPPQVESVVLTELPLGALTRLSARRFEWLRSLYFPGSRVTFAEVAERATNVNDRLRALARKYSHALVALDSSWYGFDGIHFRWSCRGAAWQRMLQTWCAADVRLPAFGPSLTHWTWLASRPPQERRWMRWPWSGPQPAVRCADGTRIAFF